MVAKFPVARFVSAGNEQKYLKAVIKSKWVSSKGVFEDAFESLFSKLHSAKFGISASSGTTALTLALAAVGVRPKDEVIVPCFTMVASAWAVSYLGATPVFVDCNDKLLIDPSKIIQKITTKTRVIMPVHIYGRSCDMTAILKIAHDYNLRVVEDSCEAHGVRITGDISCFSFYGNKIISCGEGGMCITNDEFFNQQLRHLRSMAFDEEHTFLHHKLAYNFRMSAMQSAVGLAQTENLMRFIDQRKMVERWYDDRLSQFTVGQRDVLWMYDMIVHHNRDAARKMLYSFGIETRPFFVPMNRQPMYRTSEKFPVSERASAKGFYLPVYSDMSENDVKYISEKVMQSLG